MDSTPEIKRRSIQRTSRSIHGGLSAEGLSSVALCAVIMPRLRHRTRGAFETVLSRQISRSHAMLSVSAGGSPMLTSTTARPA